MTQTREHSELVQTSHVAAGMTILTQARPIGDDFGIPLVGHPGKAVIRNVRPRTVRSRCRVAGGTVLWFTDGTKTTPTHGRTVWPVVQITDTERTAS